MVNSFKPVVLFSLALLGFNGSYCGRQSDGSELLFRMVVGVAPVIVAACLVSGGIRAYHADRADELALEAKKWREEAGSLRQEYLRAVREGSGNYLRLSDDENYTEKKVFDFERDEQLERLKAGKLARAGYFGVLLLGFSALVYF